MSCHTCLVKFNFFHKEMSCANCGLSFCSKCLKQKCRIPNKGNQEYNVCKICYSKLAAGTSNTPHVIPPPDTYLKRLESLENPSVPPITIYQQNSKFQKLRSGLAPADIQILERLERLREDRNKLKAPTESEIRNRLASLKEENPYVDEPKKTFLPDTRSDQQRVDSLLEQFVSERDIELAHNPQDVIEARIASLREQGIRPNENTYISNLHDSSSSEDEVDKITRKIMDEVALDEKCDLDVKPEQMELDDDPELPWCVLCNSDAVVRCLQCGGDLYCTSCSQEVHSIETDHKVVPYKKNTTGI